MEARLERRRLANVRARRGQPLSARQIRQPIESNDDIANAFDGITYQKGAAVLDMFEAWMGPEKFRGGVQCYMKRFANRTATSGAFLDELSGAGKSDIARSFSTFLTQAGIPDDLRFARLRRQVARAASRAVALRPRRIESARRTRPGARPSVPPTGQGTAASMSAPS